MYNKGHRKAECLDTLRPRKSSMEIYKEFFPREHDEMVRVINRRKVSRP